jgi:raffinose/stachyose/melibiose transport system substrate-binding protein
MRNRIPLGNWFGFFLLGLCFAIALGRVLTRERAARDSDVEVIRFAHWQLESGLREALDAISREYEALHPNVRVEQIAIPERIYTQWVRTQLVGGTAPDIIQLGLGTTDEMAARFFLPVTRVIDRPNPYNRGTELEQVAWRDTFVDGMNAGWSYRANLLEYYGIPLSMFTIRVFYNRELWQSLLGDTPEPADYEAFLEICRRVSDHATHTGLALLPVAGSRANGPMLINKLVHSQTQRLAQEINLMAHLRPSAPEIGLGLLRGDWNLRHPGFVDALTIAREVGLFLQPGYQSLGREDATFYFVQGRALMIASGSWDSPSFRALAPFEIGVFDIPIPTRDHPRFGRNVLGPLSEAEISTGLPFGVTRLSRHPDRALDFLQFATSLAGNARFSQISGWLPSVVGVEPSPEIAPFLPRRDGYLNGFDLQLNQIGPDSQRVVGTGINILVSQSGSVDGFLQLLEREWPSAIRQDLDRMTRELAQNLARQDVITAAYLRLPAHAAEEEQEELADRLSRLREGQLQQEGFRSWVRHEIDRLRP